MAATTLDYALVFACLIMLGFCIFAILQTGFSWVYKAMLNRARDMLVKEREYESSDEESDDESEEEPKTRRRRRKKR